MTTFIDLVTRVASDLRRSNLTQQIKDSINDAIREAAKERFYFNEMHTSFPTVIGTEYYPDLGLVELDAIWYTAGTTRYDVDNINQLDANRASFGGGTGSPLQYISRYGGQLRLWPVPSEVYTVFLDGYGRLTPYPLVNDADTNAWLDDGWLYILALSKRNIMRDVIRDYGEARVLEAVAEDYKTQLISDTTLRSSTDTLRSTEF